jgi:hypothetical protein
LRKVEAIGKFVKFYGRGVFELWVQQSRSKRIALMGLIAVSGVSLVAGRGCSSWCCVGRDTVVPMGQRWNGVKVFSATIMPHREQLGDVVTAWIAAHSDYEIVDIVITQSSDATHHCLAMSLFFFEKVGSRQQRASNRDLSGGPRGQV